MTPHEQQSHLTIIKTHLGDFIAHMGRLGIDHSAIRFSRRQLLHVERQLASVTARLITAEAMRAEDPTMISSTMPAEQAEQIHDRRTGMTAIEEQQRVSRARSKLADAWFDDHLLAEVFDELDKDERHRLARLAEELTKASLSMMTPAELAAVRLIAPYTQRLLQHLIDTLDQDN